MKLVILGCWAPYPRPGEACSGYLVQSGTINLMLDAGNGSFARLTRHIDFRTLSAVVITHFHPDHYVDLFCLRHAVEGAMRDGSMTEPLKLYIPAVPGEIYNELAGYTRAFKVVNVESLPVEELNSGIRAKAAELAGMKLYFLPVVHNLPGYCVLLERESKTLLYSGDTAPCEQLEKAARLAGLLLCESSGMNKDEPQLAGIHMTAGQAGALARKAGVSKLVLTHFWPEYKPEKLAEQAREFYSGELYTAAEGREFNL